MANVPKFHRILKKNYHLLAEGHVLEAQYFYFETIPDYDREVAIVFGGYEKCAPDFEIRRQKYPYYVLEYGLKGACDLTINGVSHLLKSGIVVCFSPKDRHHYKCDLHSPLEHYWFAFVGTEAHDLFVKSSLAKLGSVAVDREAIALIEQIIAHSKQKTPYAQQICSSYLKILLLWLAQTPASNRPHPSLSVQTYHRCRKYIDEHFSTINSPSHVASACGVNVRYMSRLFKLFGSTSPHDYIGRLKLNKAANMLLTSNSSIGDIAREVGFEDPYHFSRNFRLFHGLSPHNYRKAHLGCLKR
jgi:AraC-like DNA-binding protein